MHRRGCTGVEDARPGWRLGLSLSLSYPLTLIWGSGWCAGAVLPTEGIPEADAITQMF